MITQPEEGFCKTAGCLAGHVALAEGFAYAGNLDGYESAPPVLVHPDGRTLTGASFGLFLGTAAPETIAGFAADHLGLTTGEGWQLFHSDNSLEDLKHFVDAFCAEEHRPDWSKTRLREAMDRVLDANAQGLWDQNNWVRPADGDR